MQSRWASLAAEGAAIAKGVSMRVSGFQGGGTTPGGLTQINSKLVGPECSFSGAIDKLRAAWPCSVSKCCHNMFRAAPHRKSVAEKPRKKHKKLVGMVEISANIYVCPGTGAGNFNGRSTLPMRKRFGRFSSPGELCICKLPVLVAV